MLSESDRIELIRSEAIKAASAKSRAPVQAPGRRCMLMALDVMLSEPSNIQKFYDAAQERFDTDPVGFYKEFVLPVTPKDMVTESGDDSAMPTNVTVNVTLPDNGRDKEIQG